MEGLEPVGAEAVERGCGRRKRGGCYWETGMSIFGQSIEHFLIDPPVRIDPGKFSLSPVAPVLFERDGIWHVLDWIGAMYYPNVADFIEEARRFGVSRRLELSADEYAKLSNKSRLLTVHAAAWIDHPLYYAERLGDQLKVLANRDWGLCPRNISAHMFTGDDVLRELAVDLDYGPPMCAGLWWEDAWNSTRLYLQRSGSLTARWARRSDEDLSRNE